MIANQLVLKTNLLESFNTNRLFLYKGKLFNACPFFLLSLEIKGIDYILDYGGAPFLLNEGDRINLKHSAIEVYAKACETYFVDKLEGEKQLSKLLENTDVTE
jgi:hypothetical protein